MNKILIEFSDVKRVQASQDNSIVQLYFIESHTK